MESVLPSESDAQLSAELAEVGRAVRDVVRSARDGSDHLVVRTEGGDDVFGVDARADRVLVDELRRRCGDRWPGRLVIEGFDEPLPIGGAGPWTYVADPVDGTRGYLAGLRSAWVLLGAGRSATTLDGLTHAAAVELPTERAAWGTVAHAGDAGLVVVDDDLVSAGPSRPAQLEPRRGADLTRCFVTVVRLLPGGHGPIGEFADEILSGWEVYDDLYPCSAGQLLAVASGAAAAVIDPRPLLHRSGFATHPYDLSALPVARAAGVVVEALPGGELRAPIDTSTPVAWVAYANESVAELLRPRIRAALERRGIAP